MELEFDKEIDALLRESRSDAPNGAAVAGAHLDADEFSVFAENAMPEKARALQMQHLAACDDCRRVLSSLIRSNAGAMADEAIAAPVIWTAASANIPWYRTLFLARNLAYVLGGLVILFAGLIAAVTLQRNYSDTMTASSKASEEPVATGAFPLDQAEDSSPYVFQSNSNSANAMSSTANVSATPAAPGSTNAAANSAASKPQNGREALADESRQDSGVTVDGVSADQPKTAAAAPPPVAVGQAEKNADLDLAKRAPAKEAEEDKKVSKDDAADNESASLKARKLEEAPRSQAGGKAKATPGPSRDMQQQFPNRANNTFELRSRRVLGKDFQYKNGAWYDNEYKGQSTINVRRRTDEYKKLDSGLRTIAESLDGVVVVAWKAKAYRIQ